MATQKRRSKRRMGTLFPASSMWKATKMMKTVQNPRKGRESAKRESGRNAKGKSASANYAKRSRRRRLQRHSGTRKKENEVR